MSSPTLDKENGWISLRNYLKGGAKSGFLDKGVPVTQSPMDQMT